MIFTVPERHCALIMRFDEFSRVAHAGLRFKLPRIDSFHHVPEWGERANKHGYFISLNEQQSDTTPRQCQTRDNVTVESNASVYYRITDPVKACFEVDVLPDAIEDVSLNSLRSNVGTMDLDEVLSNRDVLNERVAEDLKEASKNWGVTITRVEIQELRVDDETRRAMTQQMDAERRRRARIAESEGEAQAMVNVARAERESAVSIAEGQAQALRTLAEAEAEYLQVLKREIDGYEAARILLVEKYIHGFGAISKNEANKVFLPNNIGAVLELDTGFERRT